MTEDPFRRDSDAFFWEGIDKGEIRLKKCNACQSILAPGSLFCPECWSDDLAQFKASGRGMLYSYVVYHRAFSEHETPPYTAAMIELEEGPRIVSTIDGDVSKLQIGTPLRAVFTPSTADGIALRFVMSAKG